MLKEPKSLKRDDVGEFTGSKKWSGWITKQIFKSYHNSLIAKKKMSNNFYHTMCAGAEALGIVQQTWRAATAGHSLKTQATIKM